MLSRKEKRELRGRLIELVDKLKDEKTSRKDKRKIRTELIDGIDKLKNKLDDILNNDDDLLNIEDDDSSIFNIKNIPKVKEISKVMPDYIARGERYELTAEEKKLFSDVGKMLENNTALKVKHTKADIKKGAIFVVGGVLGLIRKDKLSHETDKKGEERLELIFSNGTKSYLLKQSLVSALHKENSSLISTQIEPINKALERIREVLKNEKSTKKDYQKIKKDVEFVEENESHVEGSDLLLEVFELMDSDKIYMDSLWQS